MAFIVSSKNCIPHYHAKRIGEFRERSKSHLEGPNMVGQLDGSRDGLDDLSH